MTISEIESSIERDDVYLVGARKCERIGTSHNRDECKLTSGGFGRRKE